MANDLKKESFHRNRNTHKVIIATGPTAVGKTAVGLALAEILGGEVISADSVQVYRGLDVGSDKLPLAERRGIPHHLLDIRDPGADYSAGDFHDEGRAVIRDIVSRGKVPIVVGGTGLYLRFLVAGKVAGPGPAPPEVVARVKAALAQAWEEAAAKAGLAGPEELGAEGRWAAGVALIGAWGDPDAMARVRLERNNYYRLERTLCKLAMLSQQQPEQQQQAGPATAAAAGGPSGSAQAQGQGPQQEVQEQGGAGSPTGAGAAAAAAARVRLADLLPAAMREDIAGGGVVRGGAGAGPGTREQGPSQAGAGSGGEAGGEAAAPAAVAAGPGAAAEAPQAPAAAAAPPPPACTALDDPDYDFRLFFLHRPREQLYSRCDVRVEEMVFGGLLPEAAMLLEAGMAPNTTMATRAIGYRQACEWLLQAAASHLGAVTAADVGVLVERVATATHRLVRHQLCWFRDDASYKWLEVGEEGGAQAVVDLILADIHKDAHEGGQPAHAGLLDTEQRKAAKRRTLQVPAVKGAAGDRVAALVEEVNSRLLPRIKASPHLPALLESIKPKAQEGGGGGGGGKGGKGGKGQQQQGKQGKKRGRGSGEGAAAAEGGQQVAVGAVGEKEGAGQGAATATAGSVG